LLRQARRRRSDDRTRRLIGQELQRQRGTVDHLAPAAGVLRLRDPVDPVRDGLVVKARRLCLGERGRVLGQDEARGLAALQRELGGDAVGGCCQRQRGAERQRQGG